MKKMYIKPISVSVNWQMSGNVLQNVSSGGDNGSIKGIKDSGDGSGGNANVPLRTLWI